MLIENGSSWVVSLSKSLGKHYYTGSFTGFRFSTIARDTDCSIALAPGKTLLNVDVLLCKNVRCSDCLWHSDI